GIGSGSRGCGRAVIGEAPPTSTWAWMVPSGVPSGAPGALNGPTVTVNRWPPSVKLCVVAPVKVLLMAAPPAVMVPLRAPVNVRLPVFAEASSVSVSVSAYLAWSMWSGAAAVAALKTRMWRGIGSAASVRLSVGSLVKVMPPVPAVRLAGSVTQLKDQETGPAWAVAAVASSTSKLPARRRRRNRDMAGTPFPLRDSRFRSVGLGKPGGRSKGGGYQPPSDGLSRRGG